MLRAVVLGIAVSILVAACGLVEAPPPPGTRMVQATVRNKAPRPVAFAVTLPGARPLLGAVRPASVPAGPSTTEVTFFLPLDSHWQIDVDDWGEITGSDFESYVAGECGRLGIELDAEGGWSWGCADGMGL